ncbi:YlxR family protein [Conyzicola lurida]|uniref:YlxR family protein n=1 Tax=Conyzicola lurida TaxID=1172621 RepID=UPI00160A2759|nr:YlxR family protein [Conyzicola lurida]
MDPVRTCLGCRARADRSALLRVVVRDGVVVADPSAILPGRGAWVHPTVQCVEASVKRKAFGRAFRSSVAVDTAQLLAVGGVSPRLHEEQAD